MVLYQFRLNLAIRNTKCNFYDLNRKYYISGGRELLVLIWQLSYVKARYVLIPQAFSSWLQDGCHSSRHWAIAKAGRRREEWWQRYLPTLSGNQNLSWKPFKQMTISVSLASIMLHGHHWWQGKLKKNQLVVFPVCQCESNK